MMIHTYNSRVREVETGGWDQIDTQPAYPNGELQSRKKTSKTEQTQTLL